MPLFNTTLFNAALFGGPVAGAGFAPRQVGKGLLYPALRKAGVTLGPQRTPSPAQFQDSIDELNRLVGTLNCDRLFIYSIAGAQYPLTSGKTSYTIGLSNDTFAAVDFPAERPQLIESANILSGGTAVTRLAIATDPEWSKICCGGGNGASAIYNDRAFPVSTLSLSGPPAGDTLELFTWKQVPYFMTVTDEVLLPMQYEDALVLNLAIRLVTHFPLNPTMPRQVDPYLYQQARESLMHLRSINAPQPIADTGALGYCGGDWNIYTDGGGGSTPATGPPGPPGPPGQDAVQLAKSVEIRPAEFTLGVGQSHSVSGSIQITRPGASWINVNATGGVVSSAGGANATWLLRWGISPGVNTGAETVHEKGGSQDADIAGYNLSLWLPVSSGHTTVAFAVNLVNGPGPLTFLGGGSAGFPQMHIVLVDGGPR